MARLWVLDRLDSLDWIDESWILEAATQGNIGIYSIARSSGMP